MEHQGNLEDGTRSVGCGINVTQDVQADMLGRVFGEESNPLPVRGDGSVSAEVFQEYLSELWIVAMVECGEIVEQRAA